MVTTPLFYLNVHVHVIGESNVIEYWEYFLTPEEKKPTTGYTHPLSAPETMCSSFINCTQSNEPLKLKYA